MLASRKYVDQADIINVGFIIYLARKLGVTPKELVENTVKVEVKEENLAFLREMNRQGDLINKTK